MKWIHTGRELYAQTCLGKIKLVPGRYCDLYIGNLRLFTVPTGHQHGATRIARMKLTVRAKDMFKQLSNYCYTEDYDTPLGKLRIRQNKTALFDIYLGQKRIAQGLYHFNLTEVGPFALDLRLTHFITEIND